MKRKPGPIVDTILFILLAPCCLWIGFWLALLDREIYERFVAAIGDGFSLYEKDNMP